MTRPAAGAGVTLALDAHGGDHGPTVTVAAALDALSADPQLQIILTGIPGDVTPLVSSHESERLRFEASEFVLSPEARPVSVLRQGETSSMGKAIGLVAGGDANACVSAGSTVALMSLSMRALGTVNGIRRPALMSHIPSASGFTSMLDLGANLEVNATQLVQFAIMGAVVRERDSGRPPSIGLLNVGHEETKGHAVVREAHEVLSGLPLNYAGFIEGNDIFGGKVDVAVCDGFSGNLVLKSSEGLLRTLMAEMKTALDADMRARLGGWLSRPALRDMLARFDPAKHNGAPLLGLRGVVVKSHGGAGREAMLQAILEAGQEARRHVPEKIEALIHQFKVET